MRLDKFLCELNIGTRSQVKAYLKQGLVTVNGSVVKKPEEKVDETSDTVTFKGKALKYQPFVYYMLNKPNGVVSATQDNTCKTVLDLIESDRKKDLFPVGRLDKDTEGLLLITNDGELAHNMLSPKKHVDKTYLVRLKSPIIDEDIANLETGVDIGDETLTMPAKVRKIYDTEIELTIKEGRYHQVKRMLVAVGNEVVYLKRLSMGPLTLPADLEKGTYRSLSLEELTLLKKV